MDLRLKLCGSTQACRGSVPKLRAAFEMTNVRGPDGTSALEATGWSRLCCGRVASSARFRTARSLESRGSIHFTGAARRGPELPETQGNLFELRFASSRYADCSSSVARFIVDALFSSRTCRRLHLADRSSFYSRRRRLLFQRPPKAKTTTRSTRRIVRTTAGISLVR